MHVHAHAISTFLAELSLQIVITDDTELTCVVQHAESQASEQGEVYSACKQQQGI